MLYLVALLFPQQLLEAVAKIHSILQPQEKEAPMVLSADDFLPLFVNVILKAVS